MEILRWLLPQAKPGTRKDRFTKWVIARCDYCPRCNSVAFDRSRLRCCRCRTWYCGSCATERPDIVMCCPRCYPKENDA